MSGSLGTEILKSRRDEIESVRGTSVTSSKFTKWKRDTEIAIERVFSSDSRHSNDFKGISYTPSSYMMDNPEPAFASALHMGLDQAQAILSSMIDEIDTYGLPDDLKVAAPDMLSLIEKICQKLHVAARQLRNRHSGRPTLEINDEYDVQDLLHAFLRLHFDDVRPEEWVPSYAGSSSRTDFLLKIERIVIEVKKTRAGLDDRKLGEELLIDREKYQKHPDCDTLVCFIYDPTAKVGNPGGLARDLEDHQGSLRVRVIIAP
ncbi:hypothetical protein [Yoonia sp. R2-816]|uniref:PD-(D/E)XK nuclease domain-containing protein n=1 Tax=Yoonia sp. R2-816 TaxID=3342638 RepID=UPI003729C134